MTTLMKRRKRNGLSQFEKDLFTPWSNSLLRPWESRLFDSSFNNFPRINDFFDKDFFKDQSLMPAMNVKDEEDHIEIEFAAPSFNKTDFKVTLEDDVLHVFAEKEVKDEQKEDNYSHKEFSYTSFNKSIALPPSVDLEQDVNAVYENGVLKINLLKKEDTEAPEIAKKEIEVK